MARHLRLEFPGAFYHVMARGNRREPIFLEDEDHRFFLKVLSEACDQRAEELVTKGLAVAELGREELVKMPGSDARKVALAKLVRARTTAPLGWSADHLAMGNAGHYIRTRSQKELQPRLPAALVRYVNRHLSESHK